MASEVVSWWSIRKKCSGCSFKSPRPTKTDSRNNNDDSCSGVCPLILKKLKRRCKVLRIVGKWLARNKGDRQKKATLQSMGEQVSFSMITPETPQSRTTSSNTEPGDEIVEDGSEGRPHQKRVSFDLDVTTVIIQQMDEEDLRNTFYTRREFCAFKDAYRTHRDTAHWTRANDGSVCTCRSCAAGSGTGPGEACSLAESPSISLPSFSVYSIKHQEPDFRPRNVHDINNTKDMWMAKPENVVNDLSSAERAIGGSSEGIVKNSSPERETGLDALITRTQRGSHVRKAGLDRDGMSPNLRKAVETYGEEYAYNQLRLQGFSRRYIRRHFLPKRQVTRP